MQGIVPQLENAAKTDAGDNRKLVLKDDFVINSRSDRKGSSGVSPYDGSVSLISIVMEPRRIVPSYAHHLFRSYPFQEEFYRFGKGIVADLWSTNSSEMKNILIPEAPEEEQKAIANFLDHETAKIDTLIEKQQQLIKLLKEKRQAVISHAVTKGLNPNAPMRDSGVEWLGEVPEHWSSTQIKYGYDITLGKMLQKEAKGSEDKLKPYLKAMNIQPRGLALDKVGKMWFSPNDMKSLRLKRGDVLISEGGDVGRANVWGGELPECYIQNAINRARPLKRRSSRFLLYWVSMLKDSGYIETLCNKATIAHYTAEKLESSPLLLPFDEEANEIADFIDQESAKIDALIIKAGSVIELIQERRSALISAAVTGKIDVRNLNAPNN